MAQDFSRVNDQMRQALWILMQNWLGKQSAERQREYQEREFAGWGKHEAEKAERYKESQERGHKLTMETLEENFINDIVKTGTIGTNLAIANKFHAKGDASSAQYYKEKAIADIQVVAPIYDKLVKGNFDELTSQEIAKITEVTDQETVKKLIGEGSATYRQAKQLPVTKEAIDIERIKETRLGAEARGETQVQYYKNIHTYAQSVLSFLQGLKEKDPDDFDVTDLTSMEQLGALYGGELTRANLGKLMSEIRRLDMKARKERLTPEEEAMFHKAYDISQMKGEIEAGRKDEYGFIVGQKMEVQGETWEYIGNNQWKRRM